MYGLKQAPHAWYTPIDTYLLRHGFQRSSFEHILYIKSNSNGDVIIVCLYVDNLILIENYQQMFEDFRKVIKQQFEMTNLELMSHFLGIEVQQTYDGIFISQKMYAIDILKRFKMESSLAIRAPIVE